MMNRHVLRKRAKPADLAMPKYTMRGIPDIIVVHSTGRFIGIEVKGEKGNIIRTLKAVSVIRYPWARSISLPKVWMM
jgi:hypothetical protein